MGKTYRDVARAKINQFFTDRRNISFESKDYAELKLNLNKSLPNGYTYDQWKVRDKDDWDIRYLKLEDDFWDKELNPYCYPIPYFSGMYYDDEQEVDDWDLNDDWADNAYDYPHRKRKKYTKSTRPKAKPWKHREYGIDWYYGNKSEKLWEYNVYLTTASKNCIHKYEEDVCTKCSLVRIKKRQYVG